MKIIFIAVLLAGVTITWAQTFSSPVRDVENPDRALVTATCTVDFGTNSGQEVAGTCNAQFAGLKPIVVTSLETICRSNSSTDRFRANGNSLWWASNNVGLSDPIGGMLGVAIVTDIVFQGASREPLRLIARPSGAGASPFVSMNPRIIRQQAGFTASSCVLYAFGYVAP